VNVDTLPIAVAYPQNTDEVSAIARICHKWRVPIIPFSGGSSLEGHTSAPSGGVSIDFVNMDRIIAFNEGDLDISVQPGLGWVDMNTWLRSKGMNLFFPIDPGKQVLP
jgi:D-lactate dehydrogenase (cytochrome)